MSKRKIIKINQDKCNGCGLCIPNCPEGAIQIIDRKARLISDLFCDGLGACIGHCPQGAITVEERDAEEYNEEKVMENIVKQGKNVIIAHLLHLKEHNQGEYFDMAVEFLKKRDISISLEKSKRPEDMHQFSGCPGSKMMDFRRKDSELSQWPVQLMLVPPQAPYFQGRDVLIAADCVPFAYANFHQDLLKGKILLVGCPKLDDTDVYKEKISQIVKNSDIKSITYAHMEVPCCFGLVSLIKEAIEVSGKKIPFKEVVISIKGEKTSQCYGG